VAHHLDLQDGPGLGARLSGNASLEDVIRKTRIANLWAITAGPAMAGSGELLMTGAFKDCLATLRQSYDRIVIDSPPYLGPVDSIVITPLVDGVVLVVQSGKTSRDLLVKTIRDLVSINANIIGCVINDVKDKSMPYHDYYYRDGY